MVKNFLLFAGSVVFRYFIPVDHFPEGPEIIGTFVLVFEIVGVFPNVDTQDWCTLDFGYIHQWVVLVGGRTDLQLAVLDDQPGPAAAKTGETGGIEFLFEGIEASKGRMDIIGQLARRSAARIGRQDLPEKAVVPVTAGVIPYRRADRTRFLYQL